MIKQEIRSSIRNLLPKYDKVGRWHDRIVDNAIEKVLSAMYQEIANVNSNDLYRYCKRYGTTTPIAVTQDLNGNFYYSTYPEKVCVINDSSSGVRRITTRTQSGFTFFPMDVSQLEFVRSGSYVDTVNTKIGYLVTQDRIEYFDMTTAVRSIGVRMDLLIPFSKYAETDVVLIPEIVDAQGRDFTTRVLAILGVVQPVDLKDDSSNPITQQSNG
jgi:hypothetical protein